MCVCVCVLVQRKKKQERKGDGEGRALVNEGSVATDSRGATDRRAADIGRRSHHDEIGTLIEYCVLFDFPFLNPWNKIVSFSRCYYL